MHLRFPHFAKNVKFQNDREFPPFICPNFAPFLIFRNSVFPFATSPRFSGLYPSFGPCVPCGPVVVASVFVNCISSDPSKQRAKLNPRLLQHDPTGSSRCWAPYMTAFQSSGAQDLHAPLDQAVNHDTLFGCTLYGRISVQ